LSSHDFGDLVVLDVDTGVKSRLTQDKYYDNHSSWSFDGKRIIFESKRLDNGDGIFDLSDESHLYVLNMSDGIINQLDKKFKNDFGEDVGEQNKIPCCLPISDQIVFVTFSGHCKR